eukprot:TRINITY_DN1713_c2_g1_i1.p1 TRINITY_DN1713_c2_g1~~TRINITY_DN1713_c2_g1_i1.p1  ORF type:complete len:158 (-),score=30.34 TRINITY_DN1713_c2_g1_i1:25-498(-)
MLQCRLNLSLCFFVILLMTLCATIDAQPVPPALVGSTSSLPRSTTILKSVVTMAMEEAKAELTNLLAMACSYPLQERELNFAFSHTRNCFVKELPDEEAIIAFSDITPTLVCDYPEELVDMLETWVDNTLNEKPTEQSVTLIITSMHRFTKCLTQPS